MSITAEPTPATPAGNGRTLRGTTGVALAGVTGMVAGVLAPAAVSAAEAPQSAQAGPASAEVAIDCNRPSDARIVHSVRIKTPSGANWGTAQLWYSPACRRVQAKANNITDSCSSDGLRTKAFVIHGTTVTASDACNVGSGSGLAATRWVNDAGIRQFAKGEVWWGDDAFAWGVTPAY